ncbi:MAG: STAS-like domain-containing protein [Flexilinea sp.]
MEETIRLKIYEIIGSEFCVAADDGQKVYDQITLALKHDLNVQLSFKNVKRLTSAFLNVAVGQLYGEFSEDFLSSHLSASDIEADDRELLKRVIETAKVYFKDPVRFNRVRNQVLGEKENVGE